MKQQSECWTVLRGLASAVASNKDGTKAFLDDAIAIHVVDTRNA